MKKIFRILNAGTWTEFAEGDLPVAIQLTPEESVQFSSEETSDTIATVELINNAIFIRSKDASGLVRVNGKVAQDSHQLKSGDRIQIANTEFLTKVDDGTVVWEAAIAPLPVKGMKRGVRNGLIAGFVVLVLGALYVLGAVSVRLDINPAPEQLSLSGFPPAFKIADNYLALPGQYTVRAERPGYRSLEETVKVNFGADAVYAFDLVKLPGLMDIRTNPPAGVAIKIGTEVMGITPLKTMEVPAGTHTLHASAPRYQSLSRDITVEGGGIRQALDIALEPNWGTLQIDSDPQDAEVFLNDESLGRTPLKAEPNAGIYELTLRKEGWRSEQTRVTIEPSTVTILPEFKLRRSDGTVELISEPTGALVTVNGGYEGETPITLKIESEKDHTLNVSKNGYATVTQKVRVALNEVKALTVTLQPEYGTVFIRSSPPDARITVDGQELDGPATRRLRLTTLEHTITLSKPGYQTYTTTLTPDKVRSRRIDASLLSDRQLKLGAGQPEITTAQDQLMRRVFITKPVEFEMGAPRGQAGSRSNEKRYKVRLTRSFDISVKEVTNEDFKAFLSEHDSGRESGFDLNDDDHPVASVTWDDAARYLNWLSKQDGYTPVYEEQGGQMRARTPIPNGYRFPTEAEWAYAARYEGGVSEVSEPARYPWGDDRTPAEKQGNYADQSTATFLPAVIQGYDDGYETSSPVGTFQANALGVYDLGGNVAEWCHDYYDVYSGLEKDAYVDPTGPAKGRHHLIRGSSWRHGGITELRWTYRDYSNKPRNDVGFRIVRYSDGE